MKLKLFLDEDIHTCLCHALRQKGIRCRSRPGPEVKSKSDSEQLAFAVQEERCLVTFQPPEFCPSLHKQYADENREHWGIIVSHQLPIGETLRRLLKKIGFLKSSRVANSW